MTRSTLPWIKAYADLGDHPKLWRLVAALNVEDAQAVGHLLYLWWWSVDYAPDGDLSTFSPVEIARAARWRDHAEVFVDALRLSGFVVDGRLNDWGEYAGGELDRREKDAERKRLARAADVQGRPADVQRTAHVEKRRGEKKRTEPTRAPRVKRESRQRERNPLIDALAEIEGSDPLEVPESRWRTLGTKIAEIQKATPDVTPDEIRRRAANFPAVMPPHTTLTAPALATHWARCAGSGSNGHDPTRAARLAEVRRMIEEEKGAEV